MLQRSILWALFGLLAFTMGAGVGIAVLGKEIRERDVAIGIIMTLTLGFGILFLSLYRGYAERAYSILFGTILGINKSDVMVTAIFSIVATGLVVALFRPLLFSSFDPEVAEAIRHAQAREAARERGDIVAFDASILALRKFSLQTTSRL